MGPLKLRQYRQVIHDLLDDRRQHIARLPTAQRHIDEFEALREQVDNVIARTSHATPAIYPELIARHADLTNALALALAGQRVNPVGTDESRAAADHLHKVLVADRLGARVPGWERVEAALWTEQSRPELAPYLALMPQEVRDIVALWVQAGLAIDEAIGDRTNRNDAGVATPRKVVRAAMTAVGRLRRAIRFELDTNPDTPANLEEQILGRVDELSPRRRRSPQPTEPADSIPPVPIEEIEADNG